jgi:hypothetical protein
MQLVIRVADKDRARAWGLLVRHSAGTALPNNVFIISANAARALRQAGIDFSEISRDGINIEPGEVAAGERV